MKLDKKNLLLYAVTDRAWLGGETLGSVVEKALKGGATFVQLRQQRMPASEQQEYVMLPVWKTWKRLRQFVTSI